MTSILFTGNSEIVHGRPLLFTIHDVYTVTNATAKKWKYRHPATCDNCTADCISAQRVCSWTELQHSAVIKSVHLYMALHEKTQLVQAILPLPEG